MGVDVNTYRQRIGAHAWRSRCARRKRPKRRSKARTSSVQARENCDRKRVCEVSGWPIPVSTCFSRRKCCLELSRARARTGLLALMLYVALMMMAVVQDLSSTRNLHDLSACILMAGDIEENPGPSNTVVPGRDATSESPEELSQMYLEGESLAAKWELKFAQLQERMHLRCLHLESELEKQKKANREMAGLCERDFNKLFKDQEENRRNTDALFAHVNTLAEEVQNNSRICGDQEDKNEGISKRNNIKMFGVFEENQETYWSCVQTVLSVFRDAVPAMIWTEKDIVRVQRLGAPNRSNRNEPRPLIVQMSTFLDKVTLLKYGRNAMRRRGIRISSDLTRRQTKILHDLREEGHEAFYRNNKLWFRDTRSSQEAYNQRHRFRPEKRGRQRKRVNGGNQYGSSRPREFPKTMDESRQYQPEIPHTSDVAWNQRCQTGVWAHPDQFVPREEMPSFRGQSTDAYPISNYDIPGSAPNSEGTHENDVQHHNHHQDGLTMLSDTCDERANTWQRMLAVLSSNGETMPVGTDGREQNPLQLRPATEEEGISESQEAIEVTSGRESISSTEDNNPNDEPGEPGERRERAAVGAIQSCHPMILEAPTTRAHEQNRMTPPNTRRKTQTSLHDWLTKAPNEDASNVGDIPLRTEDEQGSSDAGVATARSSVWQGRLRNTSATSQGENSETQS